MIPNATWRESASVITEIQQRLNLADAVNRGFEAWFGQSKVVDRFGNPLMVYHSRPSEAMERALKLPASFTERPQWSGRLNEQAVYAVFLRIVNPFVIHGASNSHLLRMDPATIADLRRNGFDGVIVCQNERRIFSPFDPDQVQFAMASGSMMFAGHGLGGRRSAIFEGERSER